MKNAKKFENQEINPYLENSKDEKHGLKRKFTEEEVRIDG